MSDLISRSELLKRFLVNKDGHRIPERDCDNLEVTVSIKDVKTIIKKQPTACDTDKIVERLKEASYKRFRNTGMGGELVINLDDAIEIVKQGGVGKDVEQIKTTGIVKRFDDLGRIVIPKEIRSQLFGTKYTDGEQMEIFMDKDDIILRKYEGNKSDDVCEWKLDGDMAINPHTFIKYKIKQYDSLYSLDTCQYCKKKIKVVE